MHIVIQASLLCTVGYQIISEQGYEIHLMCCLTPVKNVILIQGMKYDTTDFHMWSSLFNNKNCCVFYERVPRILKTPEKI